MLFEGGDQLSGMFEIPVGDGAALEGEGGDAGRGPGQAGQELPPAQGGVVVFQFQATG